MDEIEAILAASPAAKTEGENWTRKLDAKAGHAERCCPFWNTHMAAMQFRSRKLPPEILPLTPNFGTF